MTTEIKRKDRPDGLAGDKYFNLIEHAADGIAIIQDGVFKLVNTALTHISGYDKEELLGMPFTELLTPTSQKLTLERYQARLAGKKVPQSYEVQAVTKDGQIRDIELNAALTEYDGRVADEAIIRDITERKQIEDKIKKTEQEKTDILNSMAEIVIFQDLEHHMLWVNKIASESAGLNHEQMLGRLCYEVWSQRNQPCVGCPVEKARQTGKPQKAEIATPDGRLWSVRGYPTRDENGVITGMLEVALDLTERKKAEEEIVRLAKFPDENPSPVMRIAQDGIISYANKAALSLLNEWKCQVGQPLPKYWHKLISGVLHSGSKKEVEINVGKQTISLILSPVADKGYVNLYGLDITERKRAEQALADEATRRRILIDQSLDGIVVLDENAKVYEANQKFAEMLGYTPEEVRELHTWDWDKNFPPEQLLEMGRNVDEKGLHLETKHHRKNGSVIDVAISINGVVIAGQKLIFCVCRDITERKKAEEALQTERNKLQSLIDAMEDDLGIQDKDYNIIYQNEPSKKNFGDHLGEKCYRAYEGRDEICPGCPVKKAFKDGKSHTSERKVVALSGEVTYLETTANPVRDASGEIVTCLEVGRDITERKRAEQALADEATQRRILIDQSRDGIVILDENGKVYEANQQFAEMLGYTPEETAQLHVWDWEYLYPREQALEMVRTVDEAGDHFETQHRRKDGSVYDVEISTNGAVIAGQKLVFCVCRDITERKRAEQALQNERNKLQSVIGAMEYDLTIQDKDYNIIYQNEPSRLSSGGDRLGEKCYRVYEGRDKICDGCPVEKAFKDGKSHTTERSHVLPSGEIAFYENTANPIRDASGKIVSCLEIGRNITERKQAEKALRESNQRFTDIADNALEWIWEVDTRGKYTYASPIVEQILGYKPEEVVGKHFYDLFHPDDREELKEAALKAFAEKQPFRQFLNRNIHKNGQIVWLSTSGVPILDEEGNLLGFRGADVDITERRQAEEALRESEERYRAVIEGAHDMIQSVALDGSINFVNQAWLDALGYTKADLPRLNLVKVIHPDSLPHCRELFANVVKGEPANNLQATFLTKDGREILVEGNATPRFIGDKVAATQGIFRDITDRKRMEKQLQEKNEELDAQNEELKAINEELQATEEELQHSQERLERMFESATDGIVVTTLDGTVLKVNERAAQMIGYASADELLGKSCFDCVAPGDHQKMANNMQKVVKEGLIKRQEYTLRKADGTEFPAELSTNIIKDASDNAIGLITIARDITERKQMEKLFKTVTNSSQVGIYIIQDGKFQMANPQFQKLTGYSEEELLDMDSLALVLDEDKDEVREKAIKMLKGELLSPYQFRVINKAGETRWVMETVTSITYRGRRAILGNYMDITERRQAEEREDQLQQELNLASRLASIGQLAAGVAHEINNPLTGVIGFSHLMLSRDIPDDMKQDLQVIHSEAQRVAKIVENLLVFAHQRKTGREYVAINDIITRVLELRAYEMKVNNIEVENQLDPDLPLTMADAGQLQQVFLNIVLNAEHFMTKVHNKGKLLVKTEKIDGNIRASFTDDGTGISQENLDKIFNPFFTTKEVGKGTGLGLSICHGIITQHKGRIYAQSQPGKGATFVIELPIVAEPVQAGKAKVTQKEPHKPRGAKILVVDDEEAILTFLSRLLTEWGHSVETINNANTALEKLNTERYSLVLLDIKLPGMSGIELYQHIEEIAPALARRVMFITGDIMEGTTRAFLEKTGAPYITKPLDIEVLKKTINRALNQTQVTTKASG